VFENSVLRTVFGYRREEVPERMGKYHDGGKCHNKEGASLLVLITKCC
jgi:hypothetical protein